MRKFQTKKEIEDPENQAQLQEDIDIEQMNSSDEWKWYVVRTENTLPQLWQFLINTCTVYSMFVTPLILVFPQIKSIYRNFELFVDFCFSIDIVLNFFKINKDQKLKKINQYRLEYLQSFFLFDCVAVLPGLITLETTDKIAPTKLCRFVHWNRFFIQMNILIEKIFMSWLGLTKQKIEEYVDLIKLQAFVILISHSMACIWIYIGLSDTHGWVQKFLTNNPNPNGSIPVAYSYFYSIYTNAFYFILTTITTVGYGDITGSTNNEYIYTMIVEFIGLTFFSFLNGTISAMFSGEQSFESLINARMEQLDHWLLRLENCNKYEKIPNYLYHQIKVFIEDAFIYDFNLIIEEFQFYNQLPSDIQNEISDSLFKQFKSNFHNFFLNTDIGFQHQLIINMYCRIYEPEKEIVTFGSKLTELYFIQEGSITFYDSKGVTPFLQLPKYSVFGDYQLLFDLRSNFVVKVGGKAKRSSQDQIQRTMFLCAKQNIVQQLFEQFPKSKINVLKRAIQRRAVFNQQLEQCERFIQMKAEKMKIITKHRQKNELLKKQGKPINQVNFSENSLGISEESESISDSIISEKLIKTKKNIVEEDDILQIFENNLSQMDVNNQTELNSQKNKSDLQQKDNQDIQTQFIQNFDTYSTTGIIQKKKKVDHEKIAREQYLKQLMNFKDEELAQVNNDYLKFEESFTHSASDGSLKEKFDKNTYGVEDVLENVEKIDQKMKLIAQVIKGMDKRMSFNMRLINLIQNSHEKKIDIHASQKSNKNAGKNYPNFENLEQVMESVNKIPLEERMEMVQPNIQRLSEYVINKLQIKQENEILMIEEFVNNLQSIDQAELKRRQLKKGLEKYMINQLIQKDD